MRTTQAEGGANNFGSMGAGPRIIGSSCVTMPAATANPKGCSRCLRIKAQTSQRIEWLIKGVDMQHGKLVLGAVLCIAGVALGLYAGLWWAFIGGIVDVITEIRAPELSAMGVALGIVKVLFAGVIGWLAALLLLVPGIGMIQRA